MRSGTGGPADRPRPRPASAPASFAAQQLHLLPQPALRGGTRGGHPPGQDRHPDCVVGDRASLRGRAGGAPLHRGAHPGRRHRPGRGVPALPRRARRALQPGGDPRDRRRRRQHERLDPDQACRGRDAGPCLRSAAAAAAPTPPRAGTSPRCQRPPLREKRQRPTIGVTSRAKRYSSFRMKAAVPLWTKSQQTARAGHWDLCPGASFQKHPLCMESSTPWRDTARAMPQESLEDFIRRPFIAEPTHAQTAPL
jgi:hypothetical protein